MPLNNNGLPSTLRKLSPILEHSRLIGSYFLVVVLCVIVGPFSTYQNLSLVGRIPYWAIIIGFCYAIAIFVLMVGKQLGWRKEPPTFMDNLIHSMVTGFFIAGFVYGVNLLVWGNIKALPSFPSYLGLTIPISLVISLIIHFMLPNDPQQPETVDASFFKRLPVHLGQDLYSLSVSDHYVEAITSKGSHMVLMRFGDALNEVETIKGVQLHRSHWIALNAVKNVDKRDGKLIVVLKNGTRYPVSRSRMQAVKQALNI